MGLFDFFTKAKKKSVSITQSATTATPRLISEVIHDSNKAIADMQKEQRTQEKSLSIYRQKTPKELLEMIPENNWILSLPEYYSRYPSFYSFFKSGIEQEDLPSLEPYTSCFYDWFRGVMVEKEAELLQEDILDKPGNIKGSLIDDVFQNYLYICCNHLPSFAVEANQLIKRCSIKNDYVEYQKTCLQLLVDGVTANILDIRWFVRTLAPQSNDYIPPKLFEYFVNYNSYLTDVGIVYIDDIKALIINKLEDRYNSSGINFVFDFFETQWSEYRSFDTLCLVWPEDITEKYSVQNDCILEVRTQKQTELRSFFKECENQIRKEVGLPLIGEGWISETVLFKQMEFIFKNTTVEQHASPSFLGKQHYDIYLPEYKIALEYQGQQHFEPVEFFGGEESFKNTIERDQRKRDISKNNHITLIEVLPEYDLTELVNHICEIANIDNPLSGLSLKVIEEIEQAYKEDTSERKKKLKDAHKKPKRIITEEEKKNAQLKLSMIRRRHKEGFWVTIWERGFQLSHTEMLDLATEDVDSIVDSIIKDYGKVPIEEAHNYADLYKRAINYYKKNKLYDKAIYLALFAVQNSLSLRDGTKGFKDRLEELIELKDKASQHKDTDSVSSLHY